MRLGLTEAISARAAAHVAGILVSEQRGVGLSCAGPHQRASCKQLVGLPFLETTSCCGCAVCPATSSTYLKPTAPFLIPRGFQLPTPTTLVLALCPLRQLLHRDTNTAASASKAAQRQVSEHINDGQKRQETYQSRRWRHRNCGDRARCRSVLSQPTSDESSPSMNTPDLNPVAVPNGHAEVSPMLDAISASTAPSMMNEWARGAMAGSPGNLISLMGESPPTQPSSYEDSGRLHQGWGQRNFMTPSPASPSPPSRRPLSYHMDAPFPAGETPPRAAGAPGRPTSMHSPFPHSRLASQPALPHQPQAHFYGAPDIDMTSTPQTGLKAGDAGLYFGFDTLPRLDDVSAGSDDVVLAGYNGGLDVYAITKRGLEPTACLRGLRGTVHHAKILPWTFSTKDIVGPLIAVTVHGPVLPTRNASDAATQDASDNLRREGTASPRSVTTYQEGFNRTGPSIDFYQTTVEVYSLKTSKAIDVLLEAPRIAVNAGVSIASTLFKPPSPSGAFTIKADGGTVLVCSGNTGECWAYTHLPEPQNGHVFACIGKLWTSLQHSRRSEVVEETGKAASSTIEVRFNPQTPVIALNGRWVAYCPAAPSSQTSLRAHLPVPILGRGPGIGSMAPPHIPQSSLSVELPISDSMVNKIMRETTQELIQGAKWVGKQGLQAWNAYWNKGNTTQTPQQQARSPPQQWTATQATRQDATQFPPTHGTNGNAASKDPGMVSLIDTMSLPLSSTVHPLATFAPPGGCSVLSFSPSSLNLFTASTKGDIQTVWDLLRIQHTHSSPLQASVSPSANVGPQVRQVAQFSRMTVARIVDVSWTGPQEDHIAMVTERGTVHLLDMPFSASMWPPPRRRKIAPTAGAESSEPTSSAVSIASGAIGAAYQAAKPFVARSRRSSSNSAGVTTSTFRDTAAQGGRVIAASISSSLGKTGSAINQLRHTGENRVSLPSIRSLPSPQCVRWHSTRKSQHLYTLGGGIVRKYPSRSRRVTSKRNKRLSRASQYKDMNVPILPHDRLAPIVRRFLEGDTSEDHLDLSDLEMDTGNTMTLNRHAIKAKRNQGMISAIPQAEIETSAPYQPFHSDRRVAVYEYGRDGQVEPVTTLLTETSLDDHQQSFKKKKSRQQRSGAIHDSESSVWAFGLDIPTNLLHMGIMASADDDLNGIDDSQALPPSAMERLMQIGDQEQIVVTTRRRRGRHGEPDEDGFFEDDCEVLDFADQRV
ncbi:hypothetical protein CCM_01824 [Cordyceps militaris CM01]|uniref:WD40/YVTN repeat-like-containing domain n=1 Tax=Cordyceps militaris (strain CM01) TaxID=983644 RepID=G3J7J9_CORMM|nr:uncharacterized protein CCM_01824 [Cordyceps militaris CM01]EGX97165.1 hypothetical protein CCM_01824 [Cordyceps militaris CM01]